MSDFCSWCPKDGRRGVDNRPDCSAMILSGLFGRAHFFEVLTGYFRLVSGAEMKWVLAVAFFLMARPAGAALSTLSTYATLSPQTADFVNRPLSFAEFDPSLGKLQSV